MKLKHTDSMQGCKVMNTIRIIVLTCMTFKVLPLSLCGAPSQRFHSGFCICKGRTSTKRELYPGGKRVSPVVSDVL